MNRTLSAMIFCVIFAHGGTHAAEFDADMVEGLRRLDARVIVLGKVREQPLAPMLARAARADLQAANQRETMAWASLKTKADWEAFRDARLQALRASLGSFPPAAPEVKFVVTPQAAGGMASRSTTSCTRAGLASSSARTSIAPTNRPARCPAS